MGIVEINSSMREIVNIWREFFEVKFNIIKSEFEEQNGSEIYVVLLSLIDHFILPRGTFCNFL